MKPLSPTPSGKPRRWWFGQTRTLEQQMTGLDELGGLVEGKTVLDIGCAEGAISLECLKRGARAVYGVELVPEFVTEARFQAKLADRAAGTHVPAAFIQGDANTWTPAADERYDVVLLLAVLQKLKDPSAACKRIAKCARDWVIVRLPPGAAPVIVDQRSGLQAHDIQYALREAGFELMAVTDGPVAEAGVPEWTGFFGRTRR